MEAETTATTVRSSIVVEVPIERAFAVFTEGIGTWFPPEYTCSRSNLRNGSSNHVLVVRSTTAGWTGVYLFGGGG